MQCFLLQKSRNNSKFVIVTENAINYTYVRVLFILKKKEK